MKKVWLEFIIFIKALFYFHKSKKLTLLKRTIPLFIRRKIKVKNVLHPLTLLDAVDLRSEAVFLPFKNISFAQWKLHRYYRNGSSYLARLRTSQKLLKGINIWQIYICLFVVFPVIICEMTIFLFLFFSLLPLLSL